jgi:hypothetical protein
MNAKEHLEKAEQALSAAEEIMRGEPQFHPGEIDPITSIPAAARGGRDRPRAYRGRPHEGDLDARHAVASHDLSVLPDVHADQPGRSTDPQTLPLPVSLHHRRVGRPGRHDRTLTPVKDGRSGCAARPLSRASDASVPRDSRPRPRPGQATRRPPRRRSGRRRPR